MKVLVTGGCGFIGSAFVRFLMQQTDHQVVNIDKLTYAANDSCNIFLNTARYQFYQIDLVNKEAMQQVVTHEKPDFVINFAAETHVDRSIDGPHEFFNSNITGTYNLLQVVLDYWESLSDTKKAVFRYHQVSTDEVYGELLDDVAKPFTETCPTKPSSPYSASKASGDSFVQAWNKTYGLPTIITRASNNYGPWQYMEKLIPVVINAIVKRKSIPIYGQGNQKRNWLHVDDHVKALYLVLTQSNAGEIYNIGSETELSNMELVSSLCQETARVLEIDLSVPLSLITHVPDRRGHDFRYALSSEKLKNALGWQAEINLQTGLASTVEWYVNRYSNQ